MNKTKFFILSMLIGLLAFGASSASAAGYPFFAYDNSSSTSIVVVGKFSSQYTQAEAQNLTATIVSLIEGTLGSSGSTLIYTPDQLAAFGLGDADALKNLVLFMFPPHERQSAGRHSICPLSFLPQLPGSESLFLLRIISAVFFVNLKMSSMSR